MHLNKILLSILVIISLTVAVWLGKDYLNSQGNQQPPTISGTFFHTPKTIKPFQLTDHLGNRFDINHLKDHWSFLFFGFTHCNDVCPATLLMFKQIASKLEKIPGAINNIQFILVSLDPERDSVEQLEKYIRAYHQDFIGLTGNQEQIKQFSDQFWIYYNREKTKSNSSSSNDDDYQIDHSAAIMLVNPNSEVNAIFTAPQIAEKITADFISIRKFVGNP